MSAAASIRKRWPGLPYHGAELRWASQTADDFSEDEAESACLLAATLELSGDVSACAGIPRAMVTVCRLGEVWAAVVWRGGADATWALGTPITPITSGREE